MAKKEDVKKKKIKKKESKKEEKKKVSGSKSTVKKSVEKKSPEKVYAKAKYLKSSPRKARLVVDMIRGRRAVDAVQELKFVNKKVALFVKKVIESAIANAENNFEMEKNDLYIVEARVDDAPILKRGRAGSRGRYKKILKRNCHIIVALAEK